MMQFVLAFVMFAVVSYGAPFVPFVHASEAPHIEKQDWSFKGLRGDWDKAQLLRGYEVATQVCLSCHSFKYVSHRDLMRVHFSEEEAKALAANANIDWNAKMVSMLSPADAKESYGKEIPDLSIMNKARHGGADYVYALMTGYKDLSEEEMHHYFPDGMPEGANFNMAFPGHAIAMPKPLNEGQVEYRDGTEATVEQMAHDVAYFLQWTAEPELIKRKRLGVYVLLYLVIFTGLMYAWYKQIWAPIKAKK